MRLNQSGLFKTRTSVCRNAHYVVECFHFFFGAPHPPAMSHFSNCFRAMQECIEDTDCDDCQLVTDTMKEAIKAPIECGSAYRIQALVKIALKGHLYTSPIRVPDLMGYVFKHSRVSGCADCVDVMDCLIKIVGAEPIDAFQMPWFPTLRNQLTSISKRETAVVTTKDGLL